MPVATPDPNDPFDSPALRRAVEPMAELQMGPVRRAAEQMAELQMGPLRRAAEQMAELQMGPLRRAAEQMAELQMGPLRRAAERAAALQMGPLRELGDRLAAHRSKPMLDALRDLAEVWSEQEAGPGLGTGEATDRVIDQLQARLPELSREAVRWLVIAWATAMVLAYTLYLSMEYPKGFDEVWARVGPPVIIASLVNSIFVANWKRPGDKK